MELEKYIELQRRYGGQVVARRGDEVIASAETSEVLFDTLKQPGTDRTGIIIEYVEPADTIRIPIYVWLKPMSTDHGT